MTIATVNPATGKTLKTFESLTDEAVRERIGRAAAAFASYRLTTYDERAGWMNAAADLLDDDNEQVAQLIRPLRERQKKSARSTLARSDATGGKGRC